MGNPLQLFHFHVGHSILSKEGVVLRQHDSCESFRDVFSIRKQGKKREISDASNFYILPFPYR